MGTGVHVSLSCFVLCKQDEAIDVCTVSALLVFFFRCHCNMKNYVLCTRTREIEGHVMMAQLRLCDCVQLSFYGALLGGWTNMGATARARAIQPTKRSACIVRPPPVKSLHHKHHHHHHDTAANVVLWRT